MPVLTVTLIEGYAPATKRLLSERLTDVAVATIGAPAEGVTVVIHELGPADYMRGRAARVPGVPPRDAAETVRAYLAAMEARDLASARAFLGEGFAMTFPGGVRFTDPEELVAWARPRYRSVTKTFDRIDQAFAADGTVVTCSGTLEGEWPDGAPFEGIRFVDRFLLRGGLIVAQEVWNDLAEARAARGAAA